MKAEVKIYLNKQYFKEHKIKPMFAWCEQCSCADLCYPEGRGPNFLEPACGKGPMPIADQLTAAGRVGRMAAS